MRRSDSKSISNITGEGTAHQSTHGDQSPAIQNVVGDVTITYGLDAKVAEQLTALLQANLDASKTNQEITELRKTAEEWARRYRELEARLSAESSEDELVRQSKQLLEQGKLDQAGDALDLLIARVEKNIASHHYSRAQMFDLQFNPVAALPHYEKAHRQDAENPAYAHSFALALHKQNRFREAEVAYEAALSRYRALAEGDPAAYLADVAATLNNLGILFRNTQRLAESESAYQEALQIHRRLAEANHSAFGRAFVGSLEALKTLYKLQNRHQEASQLQAEASGFQESLSKAAEAPGN